jgi:hypothetical protein
MNEAALVVVFVALAAAVVIGSFAVGVVLVRRTVPWEVMRRGYADNLVLAVPYTLAAGACWLALTRIARLSWDDALWGTIAGEGGLAAAASIWYCTRSSARAGRVLIDLGAFRGRWALAFQAVWVPLMCVFYPAAPATKLFCFAVVALPLGWAMLYFSEAHAHVCENGLWTYTTIRSWDAIEYVDWVPGGPREGDVTLRVRLRHRSILAPKKWCAVPMDGELLPEVEAALRAHGVTVKGRE